MFRVNLARLVLFVAAALLGSTVWAQIQTAGVRYDDFTEVRGARLQLNGAGVRYRGPFRVYAAGLYLGRRADSPEQAMTAAGPKRVALTMLRDIDATEFGKLFTRSVEDNMDRAAFSRLIPGLMRMSQIFSDHKRLNAGDSLTLDWVPGTGTVVSVRGLVQGEPFREPEFYNALLRIWLGPSPADWRLKEHLLGKPA